MIHFILSNEPCYVFQPITEAQFGTFYKKGMLIEIATTSTMQYLTLMLVDCKADNNWVGKLQNCLTITLMKLEEKQPTKLKLQCNRYLIKSSSFMRLLLLLKFFKLGDIQFNHKFWQWMTIDILLYAKWVAIIKLVLI